MLRDCGAGSKVMALAPGMSMIVLKSKSVCGCDSERLKMVCDAIALTMSREEHDANATAVHYAE